ncbi:FliH/SctL family protein [Methylobacterium oxalidis]|uniref:FliH/SctL family protein n=1 Tax=Methylobacterium oxalidis TaxID=944322 RepID=UPI003315E3AF
MNARPFLFDTDFRRPQASPAAAAAAQELAAATSAAHARGVQEGRAQAEAQAQGRLSDALTRLSLAAAGLLAQADAEAAEREAEAVAVATLIASRVAGEALEARPLAAVGEAVRAALQHLRGVPHLVVRVNDALVDETESLMKGLARERGYEGRLVVLGEPDLLAGDARLEWADGGIVRDRARIETACLEALGLSPAPTP